jgi:hypothetical protein
MKFRSDFFANGLERVQELIARFGFKKIAWAGGAASEV